ncbi:MAG: hypothetical protein HZB26_15385 [Candidatus Hydrogenedentes bacterium]|nr:hypothetical protein [Candidatus Hydrogenedentota bacterium]
MRDEMAMILDMTFIIVMIALLAIQLVLVKKEVTKTNGRLAEIIGQCGRQAESLEAILKAVREYLERSAK